MAEVASETFAARLLRSAEQAAAIQRGELEPAWVSRRTITARNAAATPPPYFTPQRIVQVREKLDASQTVFAGMLNVAPATVKSWERGVRAPDGSSLRLLEIAERHPDIFAGALQGRAGKADARDATYQAQMEVEKTGRRSAEGRKPGRPGYRVS